MDKNVLKEIILEQKELLDERDRGIEREYLKEIEKYSKLPHIVVISGLRRAGKSTLLLQIINSFYKDKPVYYFNFEDERLVDFTAKDFNLLYECLLELFGKSRIFFFDEIQNIKGWEIFARRLNDKGFKLYITGSNASMLSKEIGTHLTGRYVAIELFPFSFREYMLFKGVESTEDVSRITTQKRAEINKRLGEYILNGGIPEYLKYNERDILSSLYNDIIYRDIVARYDIKEVKTLRDLAVYILSNTGTLVSYNRLKDMLGVGSMNTVKSYLEYLENTYLLLSIPLYAYSMRKQIKNPRKVYAVDNGIIKYASFHFSENKGKLLENLVFVELKRRKEEIYYYKTEHGREIDFALKKGTKVKSLIQVTESLSSKEEKTREIQSLAAAMTELKVKKSFIVTGNEEEKVKTNGSLIHIMPLYKWLLSKQ